MSIDISPEAVEARCQHLDHVAHDRKSADAAVMRALLAQLHTAQEDRDDWMRAAGLALQEKATAHAAGRKEALEEAAKTKVRREAPKRIRNPGYGGMSHPYDAWRAGWTAAMTAKNRAIRALQHQKGDTDNG